MNLSPRQREIMRHVCDGKTSKAIANALGVTEHTVKTHLHILCTRAGAKNRAHAVALFLRAEFTKGTK